MPSWRRFHFSFKMTDGCRSIEIEAHFFRWVGQKMWNCSTKWLIKASQVEVIFAALTCRGPHTYCSEKVMLWAIVRIDTAWIKSPCTHVGFPQYYDHVELFESECMWKFVNKALLSFRSCRLCTEGVNTSLRKEWDFMAWNRLGKMCKSAQWQAGIWSWEAWVSWLQWRRWRGLLKFTELYTFPRFISIKISLDAL